MENGGGERKRERDLAWPRQKKARQREEEQPRPCFFRNVPRFSISAYSIYALNRGQANNRSGSFVFLSNLSRFRSFSIVVHFQVLQCTFIYITITWSNLSRFRSFSIIHSRFSRVFYIYYNCLPSSFSIFPNSFPDSPVYFYIYYDNYPRSNFSRFQSFSIIHSRFSSVFYIYIC